MSIPFIDLNTQYRALESQIQARINAVLEHGQYIMGPEVKELEEKLASYTGAKHCITVANCRISTFRILTLSKDIKVPSTLAAAK